MLSSSRRDHCKLLVIFLTIIEFSALNVNEVQGAPSIIRAARAHQSHQSNGVDPVYARYVRRRPSNYLNDLYMDEYMEEFRTQHKPPSSSYYINDQEVDEIIRCDFEPNLKECANLAKSMAALTPPLPPPVAHPLRRPGYGTYKPQSSSASSAYSSISDAEFDRMIRCDFDPSLKECGTLSNSERENNTPMVSIQTIPTIRINTTTQPGVVTSLVKGPITTTINNAESETIITILTTVTTTNQLYSTSALNENKNIVNEENENQEETTEKLSTVPTTPKIPTTTNVIYVETNLPTTTEELPFFPEIPALSEDDEQNKTESSTSFSVTQDSVDLTTNEMVTDTTPILSTTEFIISKALPVDTDLKSSINFTISNEEKTNQTDISILSTDDGENIENTTNPENSTPFLTTTESMINKKLPFSTDFNSSINMTTSNHEAKNTTQVLGTNKTEILTTELPFIPEIPISYEDIETEHDNLTHEIYSIENDPIESTSVISSIQSTTLTELNMTESPSNSNMKNDKNTKEISKNLEQKLDNTTYFSTTTDQSLSHQHEISTKFSTEHIETTDEGKSTDVEVEDPNKMDYDYGVSDFYP